MRVLDRKQREVLWVSGFILNNKNSLLRDENILLQLTTLISPGIPFYRHNRTSGKLLKKYQTYFLPARHV